MKIGILGKKVGMTQIFDKFGKLVPLTVIQAGPCVITQVKTQNSDGYTALQLGFDEAKPKNVTKALIKHFEKAASKPQRFVHEIKTESVEGAEKGGFVTVANFLRGDYVDVMGVSKGRGFQGVRKRHHFRGGGKSHGSMFGKVPGSIGASSFPSRVMKGMRAAGHMGDDQITVQNLKVVSVDRENQLLAVRGAVPGFNGAYVVIQSATKAPWVKDRKWVFGLDILKEAAPDVPDPEEVKIEKFIEAQRKIAGKATKKSTAPKTAPKK
jgi:large subunit ribosomal protein L3